MDQEKFGNLIKDIRKKYNLTQKDLADKYNVTYQAVSKWENGKNMPDMSLIKEISKDFDVDINTLLDVNKSKKKSPFIIVISIIIALTFAFLIYQIIREDHIEFKTLSTTCSNFKISGIISYNDSKSAIHISEINYCGGDDKEVYSSIECTLYEKGEKADFIVSTQKTNVPGTLESFLENLTFRVDNHNAVCKKYSEDTLYLQINAYKEDNNITSYKIPLKMEENC